MATRTSEQAKALIEEFGKVQDASFPCPRCGQYRMKENLTTNALSRHAKVYICDQCGMDEAIRDMCGKPLPLSEWGISLM